MLLRLSVCALALATSLMDVVDGRARQDPNLRNHENQVRSFESRLREASNVTSDTLVSRPYDDTKERVAICNLCPPSLAISPCKCSCLNSTVAQLSCGSDLDSCTQLTDVLSLTVFPTSHYHRLLVDDTSLSCKLQEDMWGTPTFEEIIMMDNQFHTVDNHAFMPFSNTLKLLNLVRNSLTNVYFPTLSDQPYLEALLLDHNTIAFIPGYTVMALPNLKILSVSHNSMYQLQPYTFAGLPRLEKLNLSHNSITSLYEGSLTIPDHQADTFTIDLSHNQISYIEPGVMEGTSACHIQLQHNQLINLPENVYRPIIDLTGASARLWVAGNPFNCNSYFCWIAMNATVIDCFDSILCPNFANETLDNLIPGCSIQQPVQRESSGSANQRPEPALLPGEMAQYDKTSSAFQESQDRSSQFSSSADQRTGLRWMQPLFPKRN